MDGAAHFAWRARQFGADIVAFPEIYPHMHIPWEQGDNLAALAGSPFISPFVGRAKMAGYNGIETIRKIRQLFDAFGLKDTNMIAASIKDVEQVIESILAGAHSVAVPFHGFAAMCEHLQTSAGLDVFIELYESISPSWAFRNSKRCGW